LLFVLVSLGAGPSAAAFATPPPLLRILEEKNSVAEPATELRSVPVAVDAARLLTDAPFTLGLLDGREYTAEREGLEVRTPDDWSWQGTLWLDGTKVGRALLTVVEGHVSGLFYGADGVFTVAPVPGGHRLVEVDPGAEACQLLTPRLEEPFPRTFPGEMPAPTVPLAPEKMTATVDVAVLYTQRSRSSVGGAGAIRALIQNAADATNDAFNRSGVDARVRIVHMEETAHGESTREMAEDLVWLSTDRGVANLRRTHRADLVALIVDQIVDGTGGIAWGMFRPATIGQDAAALGFSVTARGLAVGNLTFAHELGHNLGLHHDPAHAPPPGAIFAPFAYGHFTGSFRTIMATNASCRSCQRQGNYSNPGVAFPNGEATGVPNQRDNHRVLNRTAAVVSRHGTAAGELGFGMGAVTVDEGAGVAQIPVFRFAGSIGPVSVEFSTADGSAVAGSDYLPVSGTLEWDNGEAITFSPNGERLFFVGKVIEIPLVDDLFLEEDETLTVTLSNPGGGAGLRQGTIEITLANDDDVPPPDTLEFTDASLRVPEGDTVELTVTRSGSGFGAVTVEIGTAEGTADGDDHTAAEATLRWEEGEVGSKPFSVATGADLRVEGEETFTVALSNPTGNAVLGSGRFAVVTVEDDDAPPAGGVVEFAAPRIFAAEAGNSASLSVVRNLTAGPLGTLSVDFTVRPGGTAGAEDHGLTAGTVTFGEDDVAAEIVVPLVDDGLVEGNETFVVELVEGSLPAGVALGSVVRSTVTLLDDDGPGVALPPALVACDEARLEGLLERLAVEGNGAKAVALNLTFTASGDFAGLAYTGNGPRTPEAHLAFSTNPEESPLLRNPARTPLTSVSLSRYQPSSDIVAVGDPNGLTVRLNPTLELGTPDPATLLVLDNRESPAGSPTDSKPGRGFAPLAAPCHTLFTAEDQHLFRILTKIARGTHTADGTQIAVFRGEAPNSYRLNVYPGGDLEQRLAVLLQVESFAGNGALLQASLRILPPCIGGATTNCTTSTTAAGLQLVTPAFEAFWQETGEGVFLQEGAGRETAAVDLGALLAESSWRRPLGEVQAPAAAQSVPPFKTALTAAEVACDQRRLTGLLERATTADFGPGRNVSLSFTGSGDFAGLVHTPAPGPAPSPTLLPEALLAFSTNPEETTFLRNPARPQLFGISVSRNPLSSDLVTPGNGPALGLTLNPTLDLETPDPENLLVLNNFGDATAAATSAKPGRGLAELVVPCHGKLSVEDVHLLRVLTRTVRGETAGAAEHRIALFRDGAEDSYRIDVLPFDGEGATLGRLAARLDVTYEGGALAGGTLTLLPPCTTPEATHCTAVGQRTEVYLVQPTTGRPLPQGPRVWSDGAGDIQETAPVDWDALLAGSSWAMPVP
jgi:hypothetical protein